MPAVNTSRPSTTTVSSIMRHTREALRRSEPRGAGGGQAQREPGEHHADGKGQPGAQLEGDGVPGVVLDGLLGGHLLALVLLGLGGGGSFPLQALQAHGDEGQQREQGVGRAGWGLVAVAVIAGGGVLAALRRGVLIGGLGKRVPVRGRSSPGYSGSHDGEGPPAEGFSGSAGRSGASVAAREDQRAERRSASAMVSRMDSCAE